MNDDQIQRAFTRLQDDVRQTVRPGDGLERIHGRRWWHRALVPAFGAALLVLAVAAGAALLQGTEPGPVVTTGPGPDPTVPAPTTTVPTTEITAPPIEVPAVFGPVLVNGGDVLLAGPDGVFVDRPGGAAPVTDDPATVAAGDLRGGVVFASEGNLWHVPGGASEARLLAEGVDLHDVVAIGGRPTAIVGANRSLEEVSTVVGIGLLDLDTRELRPLLETEGYEGGVTRVSYGGGIFAITEAAEGMEWFTFVDAAGNPVDVANPRPRDHEAQAGDRFSDQAVLSPDGAVLAFLDSDQPFLGQGDPIDVVVWDMAGGSEIARHRLPAGDYEYWFVRMDVRGGEAVVGRLTTDRQPAAALVVDLAGGGSSEIGVGAPSIADDAVAPAPPPDTPTAAPIPAEGLGRGYAIADWERIVWHAQPEGSGAGESRVIVERPRDQWSGQSWFVFDDLAGGLVYGDGFSPTVRLRPGATEPEVLLPGSEETIQPLFGVDVIAGEPTAYYAVYRNLTAELLAVGIESRATTSIATVDLGERGWVTNISFGGGRFLVSAVVDGCPSHLTVDLGGTTAAVPALPPIDCTGTFTWTEQARLSPDGSLVAYVRAQSDGLDPELGNVRLRQPIELVVAETGTGAELTAVDVGTETQDLVVVHDFDGRRVVVSRTAFEPAQAPWVTFVFDLACAECTERYDLIAAGGGLTGPAEPVSSVDTAISAPGCSVDGEGGQDLAPAGLPAAVAETRAGIIAAAEACDYPALDALALAGEFSYYFDVGFEGMFAQADAREPSLLRMYRMLAMPYGTVDAGGETIYTWPSASAYESWDAVPQEDKDALARVLPPAELASYADLGGYYGLRLGITESGDWIYVAAGD